MENPTEIEIWREGEKMYPSRQRRSQASFVPAGSGEDWILSIAMCVYVLAVSTYIL
jgi:hypothetical protein